MELIVLEVFYKRENGLNFDYEYLEVITSKEFSAYVNKTIESRYDDIIVCDISMVGRLYVYVTYVTSYGMFQLCYDSVNKQMDEQYFSTVSAYRLLDYLIKEEEYVCV